MEKENKKSRKWLWLPIILLVIWALFNFLAFSLVLIDIEGMAISPTLIAGTTIYFMITIYLSIVGIKESYRVLKSARYEKQKSFWLTEEWKSSKLLTIIGILLLVEIFFFNSSSLVTIINLGILQGIFYLKINYPENEKRKN
jgi:hypothetical protein